MVAGEASGDLHGANLAKAIFTTTPDLSIYGMGGRKMEEAGVKILYDSSELAVVGLTEVLPKLYSIFKAFLKLKDFLNKVDLLILIDYPEFNLLVAKIARLLKKKLYIS